MEKDLLKLLDETDLSILYYLQEDGKLTNAKLAAKLFLSETPCWRRLKRLESEGFINGYQANLNRNKLGYKVTAFVLLTLSNHSDALLTELEAKILAIPEILSCHNVSGDSDYLLQVVATDLEAYGEFVTKILRKLPGVLTIHSSLSLREIKTITKLPLPNNTYRFR